MSQGMAVLAMFMNSTFSLSMNTDCSFNRIIINKFNLKNFLHYCIQAKKMQCTIWLQTSHTGIQYLCIHNITRNAKQKTTADVRILPKHNILYWTWQILFPNIKTHSKPKYYNHKEN